MTVEHQMAVYMHRPGVPVRPEFESIPHHRFEDEETVWIL
jgi:hypothetical protein